MLYGNALAQVDPTLAGIHLLWGGPFAWVFSPGGWNIQRRPFASRRELNCETLTQIEFNRLRAGDELILPPGRVTHQFYRRESEAGNALLSHLKTDIFRLELTAPTDYARIGVDAAVSFSFALFRGKVVARVPPPTNHQTTVELRATAIDTVVTYAHNPLRIVYCLPAEKKERDKSWDSVPFLVKNLQLPLRELNPGLQDFAGELAEARQRLLPGEQIDVADFRELLEQLRLAVSQQPATRPIDSVLLLREDPGARFEELMATAPLLTLAAHPKWRRVLGLSWLDRDPALQPGQEYEYRISGAFPQRDLDDRVYGFHTVASNTSLPAVFSLHDLLLRFPQPTRVRLAPGTAVTGTQQLSRRGVALDPQQQSFWQLPSLQGWSLVVDFPDPVQRTQLILQAGHDLKYSALLNNGPVVSDQGVPPATTAELQFPSPVNQLRLSGKGFLFQIRLPGGELTLEPLAVTLPPVRFSDTPLPAAPAALEVVNLQATTPRSALGFRLTWPPTPQRGLALWPPGETAPAPLESTLYQIEQRALPDGDWTPLLAEENWLFGHRRGTEEKARVLPGSDLMLLFPEEPLPVNEPDLPMHWNDVFDFTVGDVPPRRPLPEPGTQHQYRIRAVDLIGRSGTDWRESNAIELRKLVPPPRPGEVRTRTLVRDAPDLTDAERTELAGDNNLILLSWEWSAARADLDPYAETFRVYVRPLPLDSITGDVVNVSDLGNGRFTVDLELEEALPAAVLNDTLLTLADYPYLVEAHGGGIAVTLTLSRRIPDAGGALAGPPLGPVSVPIPITPERLRPAAWPAAVDSVPLTGQVAYTYPLANRLQLSADQPRDELWLGVSTVDRFGNESPIEAVRVQARFWTRPDLNVPPPLEEVPSLLTPEPEEGSFSFELDLRPYFDPALLAQIDLLRPERARVGEVFAHYYLNEEDRIMAQSPVAEEADTEVVLPNPEDQAAVVTALGAASTADLSDRHAVFLAGSHPHRRTFFEPVVPDPIDPAPFRETLPPQTTRYVYRIRAGNRAQLISEGDAMAKVVVRVPSLTPGGQPLKVRLPAAAPPGRMAFRVPVDGGETHLLHFHEVAGDGTVDRSVPTGSLLRIANRPDLYPDRIVQLRTATGRLLPAGLTDLFGPDAAVAANGDRTVTLELDAEPGSRLRVWACSLTRDGVPSKLAGPWLVNT